MSLLLDPHRFTRHLEACLPGDVARLVFARRLSQRDGGIGMRRAS